MENINFDELIKDIELVKITQINFTLSEENKLTNGNYRIPQCDLIPAIHWGQTIHTANFTCTGTGVKSIK